MAKGYINMKLTDNGVSVAASLKCSVLDRLALLNAFLSAIKMDDEEALVSLKILPVIRGGIERERRDYDSLEALETAVKEENL